MHSTVPSATGAAKDGGELIKPATFTFGGAPVCPHTTAPNLGAAPTMPPATGAAKDGELIKPATFTFGGATVATPLFGGSAASAAQTTPPPTPATGLKAPLLNGAPPPRPAAPNFGGVESRDKDGNVTSCVDWPVMVFYKDAASPYEMLMF